MVDAGEEDSGGDRDPSDPSLTDRTLSPSQSPKHFTLPARAGTQAGVGGETGGETSRKDNKVLDAGVDDTDVFLLHQSSENCRRRENGLSEAAQRQTESLQMTVRSGTTTLGKVHPQI